MSRKYLNDKYCVRCGRNTPTPYLKKNHDLLVDGRRGRLCVADLGCGNGRNSIYAQQQGHFVYSVDMVNDYGKSTILGQQPLKVNDNQFDIILCNYLLMFLNKKERKQLMGEIKRTAKDGCMVMVELYEAKDSFAKTKKDMLKMQKELFSDLGWEKIRYSQDRFIAQK